MSIRWSVELAKGLELGHELPGAHIVRFDTSTRNPEIDGFLFNSSDSKGDGAFYIYIGFPVKGRSIATFAFSDAATALLFKLKFG